MRFINVDWKFYWWKVGKSSIVIRTAADAKQKMSWVVPYTDLVDDTPYNIERAIHKGYFHITPKFVRAWIKKNIKTAGE